jgi:hypothetical protein
MLVYEYKLDGTRTQYAAIDEAIRMVQFIRNKSVRLWMDQQGISKDDLQSAHCSPRRWLLCTILRPGRTQGGTRCDWQARRN